MLILIGIIQSIILLMILGTLWGILSAVKKGFNETIRGLEAVHGGSGSDSRS